MKRFLTALMLMAASVGWAADTTYYVDPISGSDTNNGTTTGTPWQTITKANSAITFPTAGNAVILVKPGDVTGIPSPTINATDSNGNVWGYSTSYRYRFVAADANWVPTVTQQLQHTLITHAKKSGNDVDGGQVDSSYVSIVGFTFKYACSFNSNAKHDSLLDCYVNTDFSVGDADTLTIARCTINRSGIGFDRFFFNRQDVGNVAVLDGLFVSDCTFTAQSNPGSRFFAIGEHNGSLAHEVANAMFRQCSITITLNADCGGSDTQLFRNYHSHGTTFDGCHMYFINNGVNCGEWKFLMAFRDSSVRPTLNRDTILCSGSAPQNLVFGHLGGQVSGVNCPPKNMVIDSCYIANTLGDLILFNNYGMYMFTMTRTTLVAGNGAALRVQPSSTADTMCVGPNDIEHCTFVGYKNHYIDNTGNAIVQIDWGHSSGYFVADTTKFYSNIVVNANPIGQSTAADSYLSLITLDDTGAAPDLFHSGFNCYYQTAYVNQLGDRANFYRQSGTYAKRPSAVGTNTAGNLTNYLRLDYQTANRIYADSWSVYANPLLPSLDSVLTSRRPMVTTPFSFDVTPQANSPAIGAGLGGTTAGAVLPGRLAIPHVDYPDNKSVSTDQYTVLWGIPWNAGLGTTYSDSLIVTNTDSLGGDGIHTPMLVYNISLVGANAGETMTFEPSVIRLGYGQTVHVKITWNSAYPAAAPATDYILLSPADAGVPAKAISLDFGAGHPVF